PFASRLRPDRPAQPPLIRFIANLPFWKLAGGSVGFESPGGSVPSIVPAYRVPSNDRNVTCRPLPAAQPFGFGGGTSPLNVLSVYAPAQSTVKGNVAVARLNPPQLMRSVLMLPRPIRTCCESPFRITPTVVKAPVIDGRRFALKTLPLTCTTSFGRLAAPIPPPSAAVRADRVRARAWSPGRAARSQRAVPPGRIRCATVAPRRRTRRYGCSEPA